MIQLYGRDATVVADILAIVADLRESEFDTSVPRPQNAKWNEAFERLEHWVPAEFSDLRERRHKVAAERLRAIIAAIEEQAPTG